jgi:hypothetical protein
VLASLYFSKDFVSALIAWKRYFYRGILRGSKNGCCCRNVMYAITSVLGTSAIQEFSMMRIFYS